MKFTQLFDDRRAVSPVIGVILMVAITVILAAVIGTFVLGLSDQVGTDTPRASFGFNAEDTTDGDGENFDKVTITHESGDTIDATSVTIKSTDTDYTEGTWQSKADGSPTEISAGSMATISGGADGFNGETIRVVYSSPDSDSTTTLQKFEVSS